MNERLIVWLNFLIALACLPAYQYLGEGFKLIVAPYIIWMVLSGRQSFLPALLIHFSMGSTVSIAILISCMLLSLWYYKYWFKIGFGFIFVLSLLPLPIYIKQTYMRILEGEEIINILIPLSYYLGVFSFFYGVRVARNLSKEVIEFVFYILIVITIVQTLGIVDQTIRYYFFSLPFVFSILVLFFRERNYKFSGMLKGAVCLAMLIVFVKLSSLTLTLLLSSLMAALLALFDLDKWRKYFFRPILIFIISIVIVVGSINQSSPQANSKKSLVFDSDKIDVSNIDQWQKRVQFKLFVDRVPIWTAAWRQIISEVNFFPPKEIKSFYLKLDDGENFEITFGSHNLFLELLRSNGILSGAVISIVFIIMISYSSQTLRMSHVHPYFILLSATVFSVGVIGSLFGQFPLLNTFSFLLLSMAGIVCPVRY